MPLTPYKTTLTPRWSITCRDRSSPVAGPLLHSRAGLPPVAQGKMEQRLPVKLRRWITDKHEEHLGEHSRQR